MVKVEIRQVVSIVNTLQIGYVLAPRAERAESKHVHIGNRRWRGNPQLGSHRRFQTGVGKVNIHTKRISGRQ